MLFKSEFTKLKIGFALALFGAIFTVTPIISDYMSWGYLLFGFKVTVKLAFITLSVLLGISVYFYSFALLSDKTRLEFIENGGHLTYACSLLIPPLFLLLYFVSIITGLVSYFFKNSNIPYILQYILSIIVGISTNFFLTRIIRFFKRKDKSEKAESVVRTLNTTLAKARALFNDGFYDMAIINSWKAVEMSLYKLLLLSGYSGNASSIHFNRAIDFAKTNKLLGSALIVELDFLRNLRNKTTHSDINVSKEEAERCLSIADRVISALSSESCYFCNKEFPIHQMQIDDNETYYVCDDCAKKNPDWKNYFWSIGMDP